MLPFTGTVTLTRAEGKHHRVFCHPEVSEAMLKAWDRGEKPVHDPDAPGPLERRGKDPRHVETIPLSGTPNDKNADVAVYETTDGRVWAEATGSVVDTFVGVYSDLETLWMRIETLDFSAAL